VQAAGAYAHGQVMRTLRNRAAPLHNATAPDHLECDGPGRAGSPPEQRGGRRDFARGDTVREARRVRGRGGHEDDQRAERQLSHAATLVEPTEPREAAVLLNGPEDALNHIRPADDNLACPVRKLVFSLLLAVLRVHVDDGPAQAISRKAERVKPELLDLVLTLDVISEQIARDPELLVAKQEEFTEEPDEEPDDFWV
jgi:hypothetical protein